MLAFESLADQLFESLQLPSDEEGDWKEEHVVSFAEMIVKDKDLFEISATHIPVLREGFVSQTPEQPHRAHY